ncbi:hypothetical protein JTE90_020318 [Oedothorax gibbosus]|uniref:Receptor ligand binding region domain-containing protein n=1 Tax=Oedothorax gibbosus TaxID=931172 RepID=A0AAV6VQ30_9ARAC|nr:hypothetical protein JTE90_020318 [Oedothorax gibbosus]
MTNPDIKTGPKKTVGGFRHLLITSILFVVFSLVIDCQSKKAILEGDVMLGGLFPVHQKDLKTKCGAIFKDRGIQRLEAMLFALEKINKDPRLLDGIKLGAIILDTCSSDSYALNQSLEFIRASINTVDATTFECADGSVPSLKFSTKAITGVVGGSYSEVSLQVANLLRLFKIPQISPASTGTSLSDKTRYDFFARTVPPDTFQAVALVDLVQSFNWSYVSLVSSEGQYGDSGATAFQREARSRNICIAASEKISHSATEDVFDAVYASLLQKISARGVVLFTRAEDAAGVLRAAARASRRGVFTWVASDGWGKQDKLVEGLESAAEGAITVELQSNEIKGFDEYMKSLTPQTNQRNPWFDEYWESVFACTLPKNLPPRNSSSEIADNLPPVCSPNLRLDESVGYKQESKVPFVVDAVYAFAHALDKVYKELCEPRGLGHCNEMRALDGSRLYLDYILNVSFTDQPKKSRRIREEFDEYYSPAPSQRTCHPGTLAQSMRHRRVQQESKGAFVVDAVYAFAHALDKVYKELCEPRGLGHCNEMRALDGSRLYLDYILNVSFTGK